MRKYFQKYRKRKDSEQCKIKIADLLKENEKLLSEAEIVNPHINQTEKLKKKIEKLEVEKLQLIENISNNKETIEKMQEDESEDKRQLLLSNYF